MKIETRRIGAFLKDSGNCRAVLLYGEDVGLIRERAESLVRFAAGFRVFDISNINAVKEIAYYKPPAQGTKSLPGSQYATRAAPTWVRNFDWATSKPSFPKDRGMSSGDIWTTSQDNGFMVVKFSKPLSQLLP